MGHLEDRFMSHVEQSPSGCWLWQGYRNGSGYGMFWYLGKYVRAHRMSYRLFLGADPAHLMVCHTCDVRECVNPAHLFLGTARDNNLDMFEKGRGRIPNTPDNRGSKHAHARLTEDQAREIRKRLKDGERGRWLAQEFGVSETTISEVKHRKVWKHV